MCGGWCPLVGAHALPHENRLLADLLALLPVPLHHPRQVKVIIRLGLSNAWDQGCHLGEQIILNARGFSEEGTPDRFHMHAAPGTLPENA